MRRYSIEPRTRKYGEWYKFLQKIIGYRTRFFKTFQKTVHKAGEFLEDKIVDAVTKSNGKKIVKQEAAEEIIIPPEKRDEILNELRQLLL